MQLCRDPLIGINAENPVMARLVNGKLLLQAKTRPGITDDLGASSLRQRHRVISTAGVNHQHLRKKCHTTNTGGDIQRFIKGDNCGSGGDDRHAGQSLTEVAPV